ncbi:hypothetical protein ACSV5G_11125 [Agrobacterium cavarae]
MTHGNHSRATGHLRPVEHLIGTRDEIETSSPCHSTVPMLTATTR